MNYEIVYFLIIFTLTFFAIRYFISIAPKLSLIDIPNHRSSHKNIIPRGAGIIFGLIFLASITIFHISNLSEYYMILLAILVVFIGGVLDDIYTLSSKKKLLFILLAAVIAYTCGYKIESIGNFFGINIELGIFALPFTVFAIVAFTNAVNLTDGLDGLAGSISTIILSAIFVIGILYNDQVLTTWSLFMISILMAFLFLNWHPAKVFMGDSGSLLLGFIIAILSIKALEYVNPVSIFFLTAVPILDTLVVFRRRLQRGQSPFEADRNHLHHILNNLKQNKAFTVKMLLLIQLSFSLMFIQLHDNDDLINLIIFILMYLIFFNLFDPRMKKRDKNSRIKKKYQREKKKNKILKKILDKKGNN